MDDGSDDQNFRVNFAGGGAAKLREKVSDKLKEFMGDYTDDTLVEYVIVLLKNGRSKAEARNELNVFLGDDSASFVSWLWDHLGSNLNLYVDSRLDEASRMKPASGDQSMTVVSRQFNSDSDRPNSSKLPTGRRNREWRSLIRDEEEAPTFKSAVTDKVYTDVKTHCEVSHAVQPTSPQKLPQRKRNRPEELQQPKNEIASQRSIGASRRLLQFAVREAVATSTPPISTSEPALKRLRSVVSTSTTDSLVECRPRRVRSVLNCANPMSTVIKAVEEAAKDVVKSSSSGNVFDRLGVGVDVSHAGGRLTELDENAVQDMDYGVFKGVSAPSPQGHVQGSQYREYDGVTSMLETETCVASDSTSDNAGYDHVNDVSQRVTGASHVGSTSGGKEAQDSLMVQYSVAKNGEKIMQKPRKEKDQPAGGSGASSKIVNISVNVNTWKPSNYMDQGDVRHVDNSKKAQETAPGLGRSSLWLAKEKTTATSVKGHAKAVADIRKETQKTLPATQGLYATGRPADDADSRTIFVSNVHFAATKDSLSRHFNKFGEVLKVIIVTDAATGQPKGSAYVEFMRKEPAENALSLDGTSFMSRVLKVVRKSSAHQDTAPFMTWPRVVRGSPFGATARFSRGFYPRGYHHVGGVYRGARPPIKPGARSLQWKREEVNATPSEEIVSNNTNNNIASTSLVRSLTYIRTDHN